jgi:mono/diheme cytochrome c family protein
MAIGNLTANVLRAAALAAAGAAYLYGQGGPAQRQVIDQAAAARGRMVYAQHCINCHGNQAKGTDNGPDLIRSRIVLGDRLGNAIGPAIRKSPTHTQELSSAEVVNLSHFLHQRIESIASNRNPRGPLNVLTGNVEAGRTYFNGAGQCVSCHSPSGDLAGIASRIPDPLNLQQRFLFPSLARGGPKQVEVTVTPAKGPAVSGTVVRMDDFNISLRDQAGEYRAFRITPDVKVEVRDPLAAHRRLLDEYTDADMHNVVAYLETLR